MIRWSEGAQARIRELYTQKSNKEIAEILSREFPDERRWTAEMVKCYKCNHHLRAGKRMVPDMHWSKFPPELLDYVKEHTKDVLAEELAEMIKRDLGIEITVEQVRCFKKNHRLPSGVDTRFSKGIVPWSKGRKMPYNEASVATQFKKGCRPHNYLPVGTVVKNSDGFLVRKVADPNVWKFVHRMVWEEHNGPVPEGMHVTFLDSNHENVSIENLALVTQAEHGYLNTRHLRSEDPEITKLGITVAKLGLAAGKRKKK